MHLLSKPEAEMLRYAVAYTDEIWILDTLSQARTTSVETVDFYLNRHFDVHDILPSDTNLSIGDQNRKSPWIQDLDKSSLSPATRHSFPF